jgi:hypothetical protein
MQNPNKRTKTGNVPVETSQMIVGQGTVSLAKTVPVSIPPAPRGEMECRGKGAMLRGTKFVSR